MAKKDNKAAKSAPVVKTTIKVSGKVAEAIEIIRTTQPHVKTAYFNEAGEYHFHKRPGFVAIPIHDQDDDIDLEVENEEPDEDEVETDPAGKKLEF